MVTKRIPTNKNCNCIDSKWGCVYFENLDVKIFPAGTKIGYGNLDPKSLVVNLVGISQKGNAINNGLQLTEEAMDEVVKAYLEYKESKESEA